MSRSGYTESDGCDALELGRWRGQVASTIRGRRGQQLLADLATALDSLPTRELVENQFRKDGCFCALGAVAHLRGVSLDGVMNDDGYVYYDKLAERLGIHEVLAREIMFVNDEMFWNISNTERFLKVREWVRENLKS